MVIILDYRGERIRLTDERLNHIVNQHPEVAELGLPAIELTLQRPDVVIAPVAAGEDRLYYRRHPDARLGDKHLCVPVKVRADAFVVTAYVTARRDEVLEILDRAVFDPGEVTLLRIKANEYWGFPKSAEEILCSNRIAA
jgi:hypothetical protein